MIENRKIFTEILNSEMDIATGCTEPASVALCAAFAASILPEKLMKLDVYASVNIIKNAMAAGIPGTTVTGVACAAAVGAVCGDTEHGLLIMDLADEDDISGALEMINNGLANVHLKRNVDKLYTEVRAVDEAGNVATAVIAGTHTNLCLLKLNDDVRIRGEAHVRCGGISQDVIGKTLSIESIYEFVNSLDRNIDDLEIIEKAIEINSSIAKAGETTRFNLHVGQSLAEMQRDRLIGAGVVETAMRRTASGIDARMGGARLPVVTNSGSGNQGITATIPVLTAAEFLNIDEDRTFRAVTLSHLIAIYIHCNFGMLSALCGATIAGTAAACGITYLMGGNTRKIGFTINNMLGTVAGMFCDGAKPDCALKVSACVNSAFISAYMAMEDTTVQPNEGIVESDADRTVNNFVRLGNDGSDAIDNIILDIMLQKEKLVNDQKIMDM